MQYTQYPSLSSSSSTSAMIFIDSGALLREESMENRKMPGPYFQKWGKFGLICIIKCVNVYPKV